MAESMLLRIKTKDGVEKISNLTSASTVAELRHAVIHQSCLLGWILQH